MATVVDISNTQHRTFSPLNGKHNILYSRAKHNFNYRHIQKPWFDVNPFLDKDVSKGESIEKYKPENDAGIMPLQSLVIVENYFQDKPLLTREFTTREFWDFLFSDDWSEGYSVRVFVGQLQHLLLSCLVTMCQSGHVTQHSTVAYAKNLRQKYSVNKLTDEETVYAGLEETLLLEFVYYGLTQQLQQSTIRINSESTAGYPEHSTTHSSSFQPSTDLDSSDNVTTNMVPRPPSAPHPVSQQTVSRRRFRSVEIHSDNSRDSLAYHVPKPEEHPSCHILPIPRGPNYRFTCSNFSNSSEEFRSRPPKIDLSQFKCTEKVPCLGWFNLEDDSDEGSDDDDDVISDADDTDSDDDFGQQLYLGDPVLDPKAECPFENTHTKLKKRKEIVKSNREIRRNLPKIQPPKDTILRELSELDVKKYVKAEEMSVKIANVNDENAPSLEGYIKMLTPVKKSDVKQRLRNKLCKVGKETMLFKMTKKKSVFQKLGTALGSHDEESGKQSIWKMPESFRKTYLKNQFMNKDSTVLFKPEAAEFNIPPIYITTSLGITFLHPASQQLKKKLKILKLNKSKESTTSVKSVKRRSSLVPSNRTPLERELHRKRHSIVATMVSEDDDKLFPKAKAIVNGLESPDHSESEEEDYYDEEHGFKTNKLNVRYSIERIKQIKKEQSKTKSEKDAKQREIYSILRKYFRMQSVLRAFCKPQRKRRGSILTRRNPKLKCPMPQKVVDSIQEDNMILGQLKKFSFLDVINKHTPRDVNVPSSPFNNYPMELFKENMERALNEFVVRREIVMSDYNGRTSASFTFTKKEVFTKSKYSKPTRNM